MDPYYDLFDMRDLLRPSMSFRNYVTAITSKRRKPKTVKRNKGKKKRR